MKNLSLVVLLLGALASAAHGSRAVSVSTDFEGGNIARAESVSDTHVRCEIRPEADQDKRNHQPSWFYFRLDGVGGREVTVDLTGFRGEYNYKPTDGLWAARLRPAISYDNVRWQIAKNVEFDKEDVRLRIKLKPESDRVWIARVPPYTNVHLDRLLDSLQFYPHLRNEVVGRTPEGRPMRLLTISNPDVSEKGKKIIWLMMRQHAWEAGTSWVGEGLIRFLLSNDKDARRLRDDVVFKIFPMCDPDGVARGGVRFNAQGYDLNRNWDALDERRMPEIAIQRRTMLEWIDAGKKIDLFVTIHNTESADYIEGPLSAGGAAVLTLGERFWKQLDSRTAFYSPKGARDMKVSTTPGMKGRMTVNQNLFHERKIPAFLMELMVERSPKLGREPTVEDRMEFGRKLASILPASL